MELLEQLERLVPVDPLVRMEPLALKAPLVQLETLVLTAEREQLVFTALLEVQDRQDLPDRQDLLGPRVPQGLQDLPEQPV